MSTATEPITELVLPVEGMTCASCVNRIERFLGRAEGVETASVNLASEQATVRYDPTRIDRSGIVETIKAAGYDVRPQPALATGARSVEAELDATEVARAAERRALLRDGVLATGIGLAMMVATLWPGGLPLTMEQLNLVLLVPATIVLLGPGRRFWVRALRGLPHGELTMDTLVALGTGAAYGYSLVITLFPATVAEAGIPLDTFYETGAIITGFVLIGRWLEARAKGQAASAVRALLRLRPALVRVVTGWDRGDGPRGRRDGRRPGPGPPRGAGAGGRGRGRGFERRRRVDADRGVGAGCQGERRPGDRRNAERGGDPAHPDRTGRRRHDARPRSRAWSSMRRARRHPSSSSSIGSWPGSCRPWPWSPR